MCLVIYALVFRTALQLSLGPDREVSKKTQTAQQARPLVVGKRGGHTTRLSLACPGPGVETDDLRTA